MGGCRHGVVDVVRVNPSLRRYRFWQCRKTIPQFSPPLCLSTRKFITLLFTYQYQQNIREKISMKSPYSGADPGFQVRGGALKKNCAERREARIFLGYFVWKITILRQKIMFSNCEGRRENFWGISCEKSRFYAKKIIFFLILGGGARRVRPPWIRPCYAHLRLLYAVLLSAKSMEFIKHQALIIVQS